MLTNIIAIYQAVGLLLAFLSLEKLTERWEERALYKKQKASTSIRYHMTLCALGSSHVLHGLLLEIWQEWHKNEEMMTYIQKS